MTMTKRSWVVLAVILVIAAAAWLLWRNLAPAGLPAGIASGNGRIEATEIDISSRISGRVGEILVREG